MAKTQADLLKCGVRWDYDGVVKKDDGEEYHKYQLQPNAGKIPSSIKQWRDKNGGMMTNLYIPKGLEPEAEVFERWRQPLRVFPEHNQYVRVSLVF